MEEKKEKTNLEEIRHQEAGNKAPTEEISHSDTFENLTEEQKEQIRHSLESEKEASEEEPTKVYSSALDGFSDRLNNQFEAIDDKNKARLILGLAVASLIGALFFIYRFIRYFI